MRSFSKLPIKQCLAAKQYIVKVSIFLPTNRNDLSIATHPIHTSAPFLALIIATSTVFLIRQGV